MCALVLIFTFLQTQGQKRRPHEGAPAWPRPALAARSRAFQVSSVPLDLCVLRSVLRNVPGKVDLKVFVKRPGMSQGFGSCRRLEP